VDGRAARRASREAAAADRQARLAQRRPLLRESGEIERRIAALESEKATLAAQLGDPGFYSRTEPGKVQAATRRAAEVAALLEQAEDRWLAVQSELEAIGEP
jgi:ATP-binding cassette subfamily F protein 3